MSGWMGPGPEQLGEAPAVPVEQRPKTFFWFSRIPDASQPTAGATPLRRGRRGPHAKHLGKKRKHPTE